MKLYICNYCNSISYHGLFCNKFKPNTKITKQQSLMEAPNMAISSNLYNCNKCNESSSNCFCTQQKESIHTCHEGCTRYEGCRKKKITIPGIEGKGDLTKKAIHSSIDPYFIAELAKVFQYGAKKHGKNNYRSQTQEAAQEVRESIGRHFNDGFLCGNELDDESGLSHLAHMAANIIFLHRLCRKFGYTEVMKVINGGEECHN